MTGDRVRFISAALLMFMLTAAPAGAGLPVTTGIRVTSTAFDDGAPIPTIYTCAGKNEPPPLTWTVPPKTVRAAMIVDDPDGVRGLVTHWVVSDIPTTTTSTEEGQAPEGGTVSLNTPGRADYFGPCPPPGTGVHHYRFTVYALSRRLALRPDTPVRNSRSAIQDASIAEGRLVGTYTR
ncbi:YbhB/YbcL family Raf kinase inhibitor-like protein [Nocardia terpenica]|uniref:YbhB/YbcL family Raf kinase inhibitor-like protein n=1 Tax=Nocardia terpenica TaxID=455432 RepID=A0A6G9Z7A9_9NOCA|nr:YbhB/YbcL family Raf kinase inhibitor-like protein [Nocardia terpenica]QIS21495.1 YbhB/YbcL family Raf kinase inhibitor-like protein [Nocardia terpenica]